MRRRILAVTIAAALLGVVAAPAGARNSESARESKPKPKTPAGGTVTVTVINRRNANLVELEAAVSGSANWRKAAGRAESRPMDVG